MSLASVKTLPRHHFCPVSPVPCKTNWVYMYSLHLDSRNCRIRFWSPKFTFAFRIEFELPQTFRSLLKLRRGKADWVSSILKFSAQRSNTFWERDYITKMRCKQRKYTHLYSEFWLTLHPPRGRSPTITVSILDPVGPLGTLAPELQASQAGFLPE